MVRIAGEEVGPTGHGMMRLTMRPDPISLEDAIKAIKTCIDASSPHKALLDAGEFYGPPDNNSLTLLDKYFTKYPEDAEKVVLAVKGGSDLDTGIPNASPEGIRRTVNNCMKMLNGKKKIDIFMSARIDPKVPVEDMLKVYDEEFVKTGKIGGLALSEVSAATVQRAAKVTKILACQVEVSLWAMDIFSNGVAKACAEHGIPIMAYSPIGRGILSGQIKSPKDIPEGDFRHTVPRFSEENFPINLRLVDALKDIASKKGFTAAQLAISWVRHLSKKDGGPELLAIPGIPAAEARIKENMMDIPLNNEDVAEIEKVLQQFKVAGTRYGGPLLHVMEG